VDESSPYVRSPVSFPLVPTEELRLMTSRSTSFLRRTRQAGASSGMFFTPACTDKKINKNSTCTKHFSSD